MESKNNNSKQKKNLRITLRWFFMVHYFWVCGITFADTSTFSNNAVPATVPTRSIHNYAGIYSDDDGFTDPNRASKYIRLRISEHLLGKAILAYKDRNNEVVKTNLKKLLEMDPENIYGINLYEMIHIYYLAYRFDLRQASEAKSLDVSNYYSIQADRVWDSLEQLDRETNDGANYIGGGSMVATIDVFKIKYDALDAEK